MSAKSRPNTKTACGDDFPNREIDTWVAANKTAINKDLAEAHKSLRAGQGRAWNFAKFVTRAQKRATAKKK
jgi:glutathione peroxidase-family protein